MKLATPEEIDRHANERPFGEEQKVVTNEALARIAHELGRIGDALEALSSLYNERQ